MLIVFSFRVSAFCRVTLPDGAVNVVSLSFFPSYHHDGHQHDYHDHDHGHRYHHHHHHQDDHHDDTGECYGGRDCDELYGETSSEERLRSFKLPGFHHHHDYDDSLGFGE